MFLVQNQLLSRRSARFEDPTSTVSHSPKATAFIPGVYVITGVGVPEGVSGSEHLKDYLNHHEGREYSQSYVTIGSDFGTTINQRNVNGMDFGIENVSTSIEYTLSTRDIDPLPTGSRIVNEVSFISKNEI